jgi:hypothetical protein
LIQFAQQLVRAVCSNFTTQWLVANKLLEVSFSTPEAAARCIIRLNYIAIEQVIQAMAIHLKSFVFSHSFFIIKLKLSKTN